MERGRAHDLLPLNYSICILGIEWGGYTDYNLHLSKVNFTPVYNIKINNYLQCMIFLRNILCFIADKTILLKTFCFSYFVVPNFGLTGLFTKTLRLVEICTKLSIRNFVLKI